MSEDRDRAQLMVVGALVLALTILGIATLVNTASYDRPDASQGGSEAAWEAMEYRDEADRGLGRAVQAANQRHEFASYGTLNDSYKVAARNWISLHGTHESLRAQGGFPSKSGTLNGTLIAQNKSLELTSPAGDANWTVVRGINDTRQFRINASILTLTRNRGFGEGSREEYHQSTYFRVNLTPETGPTRGIYIYRNDTGADQQLFVRVDDGDGMSQRCSAAPESAGDRLTVYLTAQRVGDQACSPLDVFDELEGQNYTISFGEGDEIEGSYELYVTDNSSEVRSVQNYATGSRCVKFAENATYSATPAVEYGSPSVRIGGGRWSVEPDGPRPLTQTEVDLFPPREIAYRNGNFETINRTLIRQDDYSGGGNTRGLGPHGLDLDDDGKLEIPFIDSGSSQKVKIIDRDNTNTIAQDARTNFPVLWSGTWHGSGPSAFYPSNQSTGNPDAIKLANESGGVDNVMVVWEAPSGTQVQGVAGRADVNTSAPGDELVWYDGDGDIQYLLNNESFSVEPGRSITFNDSAAEGIGTPADFDNDGQARIPFVTGTGKIALLNAETNAVTELTGSGVARERSMATLDWDLDCLNEIGFVNQSNNQLTILNDVTTANSMEKIEDSDGNPVLVDQEVGVR